MPSGWVQFGILIDFSCYWSKCRISSVGSCNGHCGHGVVFSLRRTGFEVALFFMNFCVYRRDFDDRKFL